MVNQQQHARGTLADGCLLRTESGKAPRVLESIKNILSIRSLAVTFDDWPQNASSPHSRPWCMAVILATAASSWSRRQWAQRVPPTRQLSE
jgi:hypothetical protein